jgi:DUF438 domain-containing protein
MVGVTPKPRHFEKIFGSFLKNFNEGEWENNKMHDKEIPYI